MRLKPDDTLQEGDVIHFNDGDVWRDLGEKGIAGRSIKYLAEHILATGVIDYVERPDPEPDLRERVGILRDMLKRASMYVVGENDDLYNEVVAILETTK